MSGGARWAASAMVIQCSMTVAECKDMLAAYMFSAGRGAAWQGADEKYELVMLVHPHQARKVNNCTWRWAWQLVTLQPSIPALRLAVRYTEGMLPDLRCRNAVRGTTPIKHLESDNHPVALSADCVVGSSRKGFAHQAAGRLSGQAGGLKSLGADGLLHPHMQGIVCACAHFWPGLATSGHCEGLASVKVASRTWPSLTRPVRCRNTVDNWLTLDVWIIIGPLRARLENPSHCCSFTVRTEVAWVELAGASVPSY